jgi:hypothetical protein
LYTNKRENCYAITSYTQKLCCIPSPASLWNFIRQNGRFSETSFQVDTFNDSGHHRHQHGLTSILSPVLQGNSHGKCLNWDFCLRLLVITCLFWEALFSPARRLGYRTRALQPTHCKSRFFVKCSFTSIWLDYFCTHTHTHANAHANAHAHTHPKQESNTWLVPFPCANFNQTWHAHAPHMPSHAHKRTRASIVAPVRKS